MRRDERDRLPTLSRGQCESMRRSRETLVAGGLLEVPPGSTGVPSVIEKSWRRCVGDERADRTGAHRLPRARR